MQKTSRRYLNSALYTTILYHMGGISKTSYITYLFFLSKTIAITEVAVDKRHSTTSNMFEILLSVKFIIGFILSRIKKITNIRDNAMVK